MEEHEFWAIYSQSSSDSITPFSEKMYLAIFIITLCWLSNVLGDEQTDMMNSLNKFSLNCYREIIPGKVGKNIISSPLSTDIILALFSTGTGSSVEFEIRPTLGLIDPTTTKSAYKNALLNWNAIQNGALNIANKIFLTTYDKVWFTPAFDATAQLDFFSSSQIVDYNDKINTQNLLNSWVTTKTTNSINNLVVFPNVYTPVAYFINTILFNGNWNKPFSSLATAMSYFYTSPTQFVWREMMRQNNVFNYAIVPEWNAKIMEMPLVNSQVSLVAILPNTINGLPPTETLVFNTLNVNTVLDKMTMTRLNVRFPRFKIETTVNMRNPTLSNMGINALFQYGTIDYIGMIQQNLENDNFVYRVKSSVQKAFINLNEAGIKSSAATHFQLDWDAPVGGNILRFKKSKKCNSASRSIRATPDESFAADHPFMFLLRSSDKKILFVGRYIGENIVNPIDDETNDTDSV